MSAIKTMVGTTFVSLALLGALAALAGTSQKPPTELYVRTSPPGAKVLLDGKEVGTSPGLFEVKPGAHAVVVKLAGHESKTKNVNIRDGRIKRVILELQKRPDARDQEPKAGGEKTGWGPAVEGVQIRLWAEKKRWRVGEEVILKYDARNQGKRDLVIDHGGYGCVDIWVDHRKYSPDQHTMYLCAPAPFGPGRHYEGRSIGAGRRYPGLNLASAPGKHTLRIDLTAHQNATSKFAQADRTRWDNTYRRWVLKENYQPPVVVSSNSIEIEIVPAEARPKAPDQEPAWGKRVENLECRIRAEKAVWTAGTVPKLFADLRRYDQWFPELASASENWEIEIDGKWHKNQRAKLRGIHGDLPYAVYQLAIDAEQTAARSLRALAPGKHVLRAGYRCADVRSSVVKKGTDYHIEWGGYKAVHAVSNPIEIEIVPAEPAAVPNTSTETPGTPPGPDQDESTQPSKKVHLPDADPPGVKFALDLASGEVLSLPDRGGDNEVFTRLGKGDLFYDYDDTLGCLRGAKAMQWEASRFVPLPPEGTSPHATHYELPELPCRLLITAAEAKRFDVTVLSITEKGGIDLEYRPADPALVPELETSARDPDEKSALAALKQLERLGAIVMRDADGRAKTIYLKGTEATNLELAHLKGLANLKYLDLFGINISDAGLVHLKGLTKLERLELIGTPVTDDGLKHLKGLTKLKSLNLYETKVTDAGLERLKGLTELEALTLPSNITDAGLVHLRGLTELNFLSLCSTQVSDAGLMHLRGLNKLKGLDLRWTKVTSAGLVHLKGMKSLESIHVNGILTVEDAKKLQQALPELRILHDELPGGGQLEPRKSGRFRPSD